MALKIQFPSRKKDAKGGKSAKSAKKQEAKAVSRPQLDLAAQFRSADWNNPATLPPAPKFLLFALVAAMVVAAMWFFLVRDQLTELESKQQAEEGLRAEFVEKTTKVANLEPLLQQKQQAEEYVAQLEKQLPGKSEMASLLSDINQAGVGRGLQFELFKPDNEEVKTYYAQLPVAIRVSGQFSDIASFAADIAHLSRIVTLTNMNIGAGKDGKTGGLIMEATANTFRYLDKNEKAANAQKEANANKGAKS